jgi:hypothetical protein
MTAFCRQEFPKKFVEGYVRRSEGFAKFIKGKPLRERTIRDFEECPKPLSIHRSYL